MVKYEPGKLEVLQEQPQEAGIIYRYGLPVHLFEVVTGTVRPNQMLSKVLDDLGVGEKTINSIVEKARGIFDVRKFKTGNKYFGFFSKDDSLSNLAYLVYENDPANYVVIQLADSIKVWSGENKIDTVRRNFAASIQTSLWNAFTDHKANPVLAHNLSEIYAWSIDFFGLQQGDSLRVVYDALYIDSTCIGIGKIHGAWFRHMNSDYWAIPYTQDGSETFFDNDGKNLRKAFLKAPLKFSRISSRFSSSRIHPILKIARPHYGVDYCAPAGTPVHAIGDGVIVKAGRDGASGNMLRIKHNSTYTTAYLHLRSFASGIKPGSHVKQGDVIGYVGSTGLSTGPHLDFRFYKNDSPVDPLRVESPTADPIKKENLTSYEITKNKVMKDVLNF
jgi:murein DD-endopeptidase MepM/ murein hydrolase activator NlpD